MKTKLLLFLVIAQSIVIILMISKGFRGVSVVVNKAPVMASPLEMALDYEASDRRFEELVKQYPEWISNHPFPGSRSILSSCAVGNEINKVRILIENGADVEEATK